MTQEEKAQAYDEALNKAKIEINTKGIGETVDLCKQLFPELFESEDENLKNKSGYYKAGKFWKASTLWNATKNKIPQRVSNRYILQECTWNIGNLQDFANEVKNVQEVSLDYPIILDMNGNIIDGAHRVVKAYLEGKDIDIVYIGDDEWPEPDYDEEKAVKESEDERIRKHIVKFIDEQYPTHGNLKEEKDKMLAYLEKQKELENTSASTMISSCLNTASLEEEVERYFYYEFEDGMTNEDIAYHFATWQRQKDLEENLKSADSIPSNCVSDAKCGDRWHNVRDSLPDNTREVLCKDAIGNYFIGRYYSKTGGVWEISMYDDCDKSNEDNPPVVMWIDIPSEKQKEPENVSASTMIPSCWEGKQAKQERVIKAARRVLNNRLDDTGYSDVSGDFVELEYAIREYDGEEKQKEQKPVPFSCGHENGEPADYNEYKMLIDGAREDGKIEGRKEVIDHPDKYGLTKQKPMDFPTTDEEVKEFLETHPKVEVPEKYKTPDFVFSKQEYEPHSIISTDTTSVKPREIDGKALLYTADKSYQIGFRDGVASVKPAEWSEEDEDMLNSCISSIEEAKENRYAYKETDGDTSYDHEIAWLKSLRPTHWKPSEHQMNILKAVKDYVSKGSGYWGEALGSLIEDLEKLI